MGVEHYIAEWHLLLTLTIVFLENDTKLHFV